MLTPQPPKKVKTSVDIDTTIRIGQEIHCFPYAGFCVGFLQYFYIPIVNMPEKQKFIQRLELREGVWG